MSTPATVLTIHQAATLKIAQAFGPATLAIIHRYAPDPKPRSDALRARLEALARMGLIGKTTPGKSLAPVYGITGKGRRALGAHNDKPALRLERSPRSMHFSEPANYLRPGSYNGAELRPFDGRPGAMDAFQLPSLVDGRQVERVRAPRPMAASSQDKRGGA